MNVTINFFSRCSLALIFTCLFILNPISRAKAQLDNKTQKQWTLVTEDVLVMRIQSRQIFLSDLKIYHRHLEAFACLFPESLLLSLAQVEKEQRDFLAKAKVAQVKKNPEPFKKFQNLLIAQVYNNSLELSLTQGFDLELPLERCSLGRFGTWNNELKSLVQAELYLKKREEGTFILNEKSRQAYFKLIDQKMDYEFFL